MPSGGGPRAAQHLSSLLASGAPIADSHILDYLEELDSGPQAKALQAGGGSSSSSGSSALACMRLAGREQEIRVDERQCTPSAAQLVAGGRVAVRVTGGPHQSFTIGRDVEDAFVTPAIPAGSSYEWTPPEPGHYCVASEVYPHLRATIKVVSQAEAAAAAAESSAGSLRLGGSTRSSMAGEPSGRAAARTTSAAETEDGSSMAGVEDTISFPLRAVRRTPITGAMPPAAAALAGTDSCGTQTDDASRQAGVGGVNPGLVLGRFQRPGAAPTSGGGLPGTEEEEEEPGSLLDPPPESGLRRRGRGGAPPNGALPELARPAAPAGADAFSALSGGSGSPRSGSGSERSPPLFVQPLRPGVRVPGGMLQPSHAFSVSRPAGYAHSSDSRSLGGSEEMQPLLYGQRGQHLQGAGNYLRGYPAAQQAQQAQMEAPKADLSKCPRCRKEYLSTINYRRCMSSHLGASGSKAAARGVADPKRLADFWDGLGEEEKRGVMNVRAEHNGELTLSKLEQQLLHRKRTGVTEGLTKEQKRLHLAGKMLQEFCDASTRHPGGGGGGGAAFSGSNLVSVLSQVSEGTFLFDRAPIINREELVAGNNLEAGLGALVTRRLVEAHLAAKQRDAARLASELEALEEAQAPAQKGKQQGVGPAGAAKKATKSKAKGKGAAAAAAAAPAAKPASSAAPAGQAASSSEPEQDAVPAPAAGGEQHKQQKQQQEEGEEGALSPPSAGGRYGSSPQRAAASDASSRYTNFLFAEEAAEAATVEAEDGWHTASSGRPSSRSSARGSSKRAGPGVPSSGGAATNGTKGSSSGSSSGRAAERTASGGAVPAVERPASKTATSQRPAANGTSAAAAPPHKAAARGGYRAAAAAAAPTAPSNGKLQPRNVAAPAGKQQERPPREDSFPELPAAAGGKAAQQAPSAAPAVPPGFSYVAAARASRQEGSKAAAAAAAPKPEASQPAQEQVKQPASEQQQQQQPPAAERGSSIAEQPKSWPVPGVPAAPAAAQAAPAAAASATPQASAAGPEPAAAAAPAAAPPAGNEQPAAAAAPAAVAGPGPLAGAELQRSASITPPISDAGSPPPGPLLPPGAYAMPPGAPLPGWVGPDGGMVPPPPLPPGCYWAFMPPLPGMQFGDVDVGEMLPPGPYPYPAFCPPYMPPPGPGGPMQPPPGMPHGPHPMMYGGEGAHLAPYPPGMPVPLPPEVAAELAAAAGPAQPGAPAAPGRKPAAAAAAAPDSRVEPAEGAAEAQQPDVPSSGGESRAAAGPAGFLALLQRSCGGVQLILPGSGQRRRRQGFDAAATAAEFERRWQAAAPTAVPACSLEPAAEQWPAAAAAPQPPSRSSSGSLSSKGTPSVAAKRAPSGSCSGRSSPAGGAPGGKPVVVAVRAWTTDDSADDGHVGKWRIQTANPSAEHQAQQAQAQQA